MTISDPNNPFDQASQAAQSQTTSRPVRRYRAILFQAYLIAAVCGFVVLALLARTTAYFAVDLAISQALQALSSGPLDALMRFISWFGYAPQAIIVVVLMAGALFGLGFQKEGWTALAVAAFHQILNTLVKWAVHRPRPSKDIVEIFRALTSYSFPSGHVMFYTAFFGFFWYLTYILMRRSWLRTGLLVCFGLLILLIGPSRIYLGEHWASDVLGGYLLGSLVLTGVIQIYSRWAIAPGPQSAVPRKSNPDQKSQD